MRRPTLKQTIVALFLFVLVVSVLLPSSVPRHSGPDPRVPADTRDVLIAISEATLACIRSDSRPETLDDIRSVPPLAGVEASALDGVVYTPEFLMYTERFGGGMVAYKPLAGQDGYAVVYHFPKRIVFRSNDDLMLEIRLRRENLADQARQPTPTQPPR